MRQISEQRFETIITRLKKLDSFNKFVEKVQKRVNSFINKPQFVYLDKDANGKDKKITFNINTAIGSKKIKYSKILDSISDIEELFFMSPTDLKKIKKKMKGLDLKENDNIDKSFSHTIQSILMYKDLRSGTAKLLHCFYSELGIKTCVYCNSQHTIILDDDERTMRLQADHFIAKSKYPAFSITLANLYPTCNNCNHLKNDKDIFYSLYYDEALDNHHDLGFKITPKSLNKYYLNKNKEDAESHLDIKFTDYYSGDVAKSSNLNDVLKLEKIYENHKDIAADLIIKKITYKDSYLKKLASQFEKLFKRDDGTINEQLFNQMIYGHSLKEDDINKRVFSKLTIDLKKQLDNFDFKDKNKSTY